MGSPFADFYADLNKYIGDDTLPQDPEGYGEEVWFENFLKACGAYYDESRLVAFPYDCAVACTFYRRDLFEMLSKDFEAEYGYRMEFTADTTWKNLYDFAAFFKKMREGGNSSVPYGYAQHQGSFAWTTQLDIQRMMFAKGRWIEFDIDDILGSKNPVPTNW
ncbi:MAG: extracellular solute-binding protein, partial [Gammaproteobacteria bacterium]|nr:extracellular solute-binding protein [Gammaproteobacteria bacterium]